MDSSSSSSSPPWPIISCPEITDEEFNAFHTVDRKLYATLIMTLHRDTAQSMHLMSLWIWLERAARDFEIVGKILSLPTSLINVVADESLLCLNAIQVDQLSINLDQIEIPNLQALVKEPISLRYFHENRILVLQGVTKVLNEVCVRAFADILNFGGGNLEGNGNVVINNSCYPSVIVLPVGGVVPQFWGNYVSGEMLRNVGIEEEEKKEKEVVTPPIDDRTIFLTFSKGYPISENEVQEFFIGY